MINLYFFISDVSDHLLNTILKSKKFQNYLISILKSHQANNKIQSIIIMKGSRRRQSSTSKRNTSTSIRRRRSNTSTK